MVNVRHASRVSTWRAGMGPAVALGSITACVELARVARDALFITTVGAAEIPKTYLAVAVAMFILSAIYSGCVRRLGVYTLLRMFLCLCGVFLTSMWTILETGNLPRVPVIYVLFCAVEAFFIFLPMAFWALMNDRYNPSEGASIFPAVGVGGVLGVVVGGTIPRLVEAFVDPVQLLAVSAFLIIPSLFLSRRVGERETAIACDDGELVAGQTLWSHPLVRTLTYLALPMWILVYIIEFTYYEALGRVFSDEKDLAGFLGLVVSVASIAGLLVQVFVTPVLLRMLGVGTTAVVYPLFLALGGILVLVYSMFPESTSSTADLGGVVGLVLLSRLFDLALYFSVQESSLHLLFYAVPSRQRPRARALISGTIFPLSIGLAGALLLLFKSTDQPVYSIAFAGATIGFLLLVVALNIAPDYLRSRMASASTQDPNDRNNLLAELATVPLSETRYVFLESITSKNLTEALFAAEQLSGQADEELLYDLAEIASSIHPKAISQFLHGAPEEILIANEPETALLIERVRNYSSNPALHPEAYPAATTSV